MVLELVTHTFTIRSSFYICPTLTIFYVSDPLNRYHELEVYGEQLTIFILLTVNVRYPR